MIIFCLREHLHRDTAPLTFPCFIKRDFFPSAYKNCTATAPSRIKNCTWPPFAKASEGKDGKKHAILALQPGLFFG
jgi:hypothetical protein